jgi:leucyl aminopeptidase
MVALRTCLEDDRRTLGAIRLAVNNLTDSHVITAITPASPKSNAAAPGDVLTLMSGRSVSVSLTVGLSGK